MPDGVNVYFSSIVDDSQQGLEIVIYRLSLTACYWVSSLV